LGVSASQFAQHAGVIGAGAVGLLEGFEGLGGHDFALAS